MPIQTPERRLVPSSHSTAATSKAPHVQPEPAAVPAEAPDSFEDDVDVIIAHYRQAGRELRSGDPADWGACITMPQLRVLYFLRRNGPSSVGDVANGVSVSQPSVTETLDRLVRGGLVERMHDPHDRRVVRSALTAAGIEIIDRPWESRRAVLAHALRDASPEDRAVIAHGLETLCRVLASHPET